jgi:uncharacterized membrane protein YfcA
MSENAKLTVAFLVFAGGLILGLIGWMTDVYNSTTGTIIILTLLFISIALRILWRLRRGDRKSQ